MSASPEHGTATAILHFSRDEYAGRVERAQPRAGQRRLVLADLAPDLVETGVSKSLRIERKHPDQQFVQEHAQRIHVGARVDI